MVIREYFVILLLSHIIGDFYFQTESIADKKAKSLKWVMFHCIFYWFAMMSVSMLVISDSVFIYGSGAAIIHALLDLVKYYIILKVRDNKKMNLCLDQRIFYIDQILHLCSLFIIAFIYTVNVGELNLASGFVTFTEVTGISYSVLASWITALLVIHKPANITISKMLSMYRPKDKDSGRKQINNAGRFIGTAERIIMLVFISIGQYSAMGLVLTAKSIARYDKIVKEPEFAEYYLLGTLLSTLAVVAASFLI